MKKIFAVVSFLFAFAISANAQDQKSYDEAAKKDALALIEFLGLKESMQEDFTSLFKKKHETLQNPDLSDLRKVEVSKMVAARIRAELSPDQVAKLNGNEELVKQLENSYLN